MRVLLSSCFITFMLEVVGLYTFETMISWTESDAATFGKEKHIGFMAKTAT